jgi:hypothetical protein
VRACTAVAAAALVAAGCGGGERHHAGEADGPYRVDLERAQFPVRQRIAERSTFLITVRNAGDRTIPNLSVTLHGFSRRTSSSRDADPEISLWTLDQPPAGSGTAVQDTWAAGALKAGKRVNLRWRVTAIVAGTHTLSYSIAPSLRGNARAQLAGGGPPRGTLTVMVDAKPALARVDPRSGGVIREE